MIRRFNAVIVLMLTTFVGHAALAQESAPLPSATADTVEKLDLRIPDITELYTHEQIQAFLAPTFYELTEEVEVRGRREAVTPKVWPGIAAPIWAIFNPTQAWRIFAPLPPDRSGTFALNADMTAPYQEPAARTAADL